MSFSFEIREETVLDVLLPVRWRNLYPGKVLDSEASRETDMAEGTVHFVAIQNDARIGGCVTLTKEFQHQRHLRMRWLGVDEALRGHGIGCALAQACLDESLRRGGGIWCNARLGAVPLYQRLGFEAVGVPFDILAIGPHLVMRTP
ncbi:MAG: GNAT family N-acetyltransferase [Opitutales bacterium]